MKLAIYSFALLMAAAVIAPKCSAQITHYDSLTASVIIPSIGVDFGNNALGVPDNKQAKLNPNGNLDIGFATNGHLTAFNTGATIHIFWNKESDDSNGAILTFFKFTDSYIELGRKDSILIDQPGMVTVTAPDGGYNVLDFSLTGGTDLGGSRSFYVDAISLLQSGTAAVNSSAVERNSLAGFPNPFNVSGGTSVELTTEFSGRATLHLYDLLGREIQTIDLGHVDAGSRNVTVRVPSAGSYVARVSVDGTFTGRPLKLIAE